MNDLRFEILEAEMSRLEVVEIRRGDTVVLTLNEQHLPADAIERVADDLRKRFPDNECLVIVGGDLRVMRQQGGAGDGE